jgi:hypothetical protein
MTRGVLSTREFARRAHEPAMSGRGNRAASNPLAATPHASSGQRMDREAVHEHTARLRWTVPPET